MKKNILISGALNERGIALAKAFRARGFYIYGLDKKEDYEGVCDRALRFDIQEFAANAEYRIRFTQIFEEIIPRLNALIHNEEVSLIGHLNEIQLDHWQQSLDINLTGPMLLSKLFISKLESSKGAMLNIVTLSNQSINFGHMAFSAPENAMQSMTKSIAADKKGNVVVNSITILPDNELERLPLLRLDKKEYEHEIAKLAVYLIAENGGYVHGLNILMDGGFSRFH